MNKAREMVQAAADVDVALAEFQARGRAGVLRGSRSWLRLVGGRYLWQVGPRPAETETAGMNVPRRARQ